MVSYFFSVRCYETNNALETSPAPVTAHVVILNYVIFKSCMKKMYLYDLSNVQLLF